MDDKDPIKKPMPSTQSLIDPMEKSHQESSDPCSGAPCFPHLGWVPWFFGRLDGRSDVEDVDAYDIIYLW